MSASFALRRLASSAPASTASAWTVASRRSMSGGHTKPKFEGIEATLRTYLPENHHVVYAMLGMYASIGILVSVRGSFNAAAAVVAQPAPEKPDYSTPLAKSSSIPTMVDNPKEWEAFVSQPGGFERWALGDAAPAPAGH